MKLEVCDTCRSTLIDLLERRIRKILEVGRAEAAFQSADFDQTEFDSNADIGQSECFHLMELIRILKGQKTCGVFDDYGEPVTIKGPLFHD